MRKFIAFMIFILLIPVSYSDGGCVKIAGNNVFVQLSMVPLNPEVNQQASMLFSFGDYNGLLNGEINGNMTIMHNNKPVFTRDFKIKDGILDLKHTFNEPGYYEIFLDFDFKNKKYTPEDFLIEVKEKEQNLAFNIVILIIGILIGAILMKLIKIK